MTALARTMECISPFSGGVLICAPNGHADAIKIPCNRHPVEVRGFSCSLAYQRADFGTDIRKFSC